MIKCFFYFGLVCGPALTVRTNTFMLWYLRLSGRGHWSVSLCHIPDDPVFHEKFSFYACHTRELPARLVELRDRTTAVFWRGARRNDSGLLLMGRAGQDNEAERLRINILKKTIQHPVFGLNDLEKTSDRSFSLKTFGLSYYELVPITYLNLFIHLRGQIKWYGCSFGCFRLTFICQDSPLVVYYRTQYSMFGC